MAETETVSSQKAFPALKNDLVLRAARGDRTERVPVWVMRQAGRYLPEFMEIKEKHEFFEICRTASLACEVTLQPVHRFDVDAAIIFSDILVVPQALGMSIEMKPGPVFEDPLRHPDDIYKLCFHRDINQELDYVYEAITLTRHALEGKVPLFGFAGAPWTLMSYMIEGGATNTNILSKSWLYNYPVASKELLQKLTDIVVEFLVGQVNAGAQILQVFESAAGCLGPSLFNRFALPYLRQIAVRVKEKLREAGLDQVPIVVFALSAHYALDELSTCSYDVIGIDWTIKPSHARRVLGSSVTIQGNLDPVALFAGENELRQCVKEMLHKFGTQHYIANLGHGINKDTDPDNMKAFVDAVHMYSEEMNAKS